LKGLYRSGGQWDDLYWRQALTKAWPLLVPSSVAMSELVTGRLRRSQPILLGPDGRRPRAMVPTVSLKLSRFERRRRSPVSKAVLPPQLHSLQEGPIRRRQRGGYRN
jgi:hypothetical protein